MPTETPSIRAVLRDHPFFEGLDAEHLDKLVPLSREVHFERGYVIFQEGDQSDAFFLLTNGKVAIEVVGPTHTHRVQTLEGGEELGWSALMPGGGKQFQARALSAVKAVSIDAAAMRKLCDEDAVFGRSIAKRMLGVVASRLQATRLQLLDLYAPRSQKT